jgi:predicted XRE-type DNA-binding protein
LIAAEKLTQAQAAQRLGLDQPKVSALVRGRLEGFSTDRLMRFLVLLGRDVHIVIRRRGQRGVESSERVVRLAG